MPGFIVAVLFGAADDRPAAKPGCIGPSLRRGKARAALPLRCERSQGLDHAPDTWLLDVTGAVALPRFGPDWLATTGSLPAAPETALPSGPPACRPYPGARSLGA